MKFTEVSQTQALSDLAHSSQFTAFVEMRQSLPSRVEAIPPFVDHLMGVIKRFRNADGSELDIEIAVREALTNAVVHGNRENPKTRVYVTYRCSADGEVLITVRDQGLGFNYLMLPDPTAPWNRLSPNGRGVYLMRAFMDEVHFKEGGSVVTMRKLPNGGPHNGAGK
jgi:serine/threonine-protein kinase RsbW